MLACLYTSFIEDVRSRRRLFFKKGHLTDKFDDRVGHLNTILARGGGNLKDPIFKSSNARLLPGGRGMLKFRVDRRINGRSNTGVLPSILNEVSGRAFCEESNNLICTRNKTKVRQFGSTYLSPCEHGKMQ